MVLLVSFLISTTGFLLYNSYCCCTGTSKVSLFVASRVCSHSDIYVSAEIKGISCCETQATHCRINDNDCNCGNLDIRFVKLESEVITIERNYTFFVEIPPFFALKNIDNEKLADCFWQKNTFLANIEPPPCFYQQNDYLNFLCQLKIPCIA